MIPVVLALLLVLAVGIAMQRGLATKSDIEFLVDLGQRAGLSAVISIVKAEIYGVDLSVASDPSYGREQVPGRGYAPWVLRGNLDGRPRMLKLALAPKLWAAYDTQQMSLYQAWQGNAQQVAKIRRIVEELSREVATPDETRAMLARKGSDRVGF